MKRIKEEHTITQQEVASFTEPVKDPDTCYKNNPHQFFRIANETRKEGDPLPVTVRWGIIILCAICSQRRVLWTDGEVEIL